MAANFCDVIYNNFKSIMNTRTFVSILKTLQAQSINWNPPVIDLMAVQGSSPYHILIATILSARTKDEVTAIAAKRLFKKAPTVKKLSSLSSKEIEKLIFPVGFYKNKAKYLKENANILINNYHSKVPDSLSDLIKLNGVGRKTANLVLAQAFKIPAICVDIHVFRISNRMGFLQTETPLETEHQLCCKVPKKYWSLINQVLVAFGQTICRPVSPHCEKCLITKKCLYYKKHMNVVKK